MTPGMGGRHHRAWGLTGTHSQAYARHFPAALRARVAEVAMAFSSAILNIVRGYDVRQALDTAVRQIDGNLAAYGFYKTSEP